MTEKGRGFPPIEPVFVAERENKEAKKNRWEHEFKVAIDELQKYQLSLGGKKPKTGEEIRQMNGLWDRVKDMLCNAPFEFRGMLLTLSFTKEDIRGDHSWGNYEVIEQLGIKPKSLDTPGRTYEFPLLAPRRVDWSRSGFSEWEINHNGSPVREWAAQHPAMISAEYATGWTDRKTGQQGMLHVLPRISPFAEHFHLFPRNLIEIKLTENVPDYLDEDERGGVENWYRTETTPQ